MDLAVGEIISGKVTGITKFGAFVSLPEGKTGLVHISEVDQSYVSNIRDHLTEGQEVKVKIIAIDEVGRVNLSIKKAQPRAAAEQRPSGRSGVRGGSSAPRSGSSGKRYPRALSADGYVPRQPAKDVPISFEEKLKHFMQDSESRMADIRHNRDKKTGARRRK
ncbi:MAG TPA: S1 RNA-binding domain-containing protein [Candidatus Butyricicoccus stercorigallinarum]|nr:S1 RNA-binding domain-containing protein [Candidatus Butyricicoccus stercorigallinarum]